MDAAVWTAIGLLAATSLGTLFYLGARIDGLGARIDSLAARMDAGSMPWTHGSRTWTTASTV
jgi:hypothetical protein